MLAFMFFGLHLVGAGSMLILIVNALVVLAKPNLTGIQRAIRHLNYVSLVQITSGGFLAISRGSAPLATCARLLLYLGIIVAVQSALLLRERHLGRQQTDPYGMATVHLINLAFVSLTTGALL